MMSIIQKSSSLNTALKASSYVVAIPASPSLTPTSLWKEEFPSKVEENRCKVYITTSGMKSGLPKGFGRLAAISSITNTAQFRFLHNDVTVPDMTKYRRTSTRDPTRPASKTVDQRRAFTYIFTGGALASTALIVKTAVVKVVMYYTMNQDCVALGAVEIDISKVPEGKSITFKWQGKPLFVKHRSAEEIEDVRNVPLSQLRDPETDESRVKHDKYLVALGICTHLGCVPVANKGICLGGYFCPCHGSHYDASGRIRRGPAPSNLEIPEYKFISDTTILVGKEIS